MTKKKIELYPVQYDFLRCPDNFSAFIGGIGSGKTYVGALKAIMEAKPGTLGMVVAPTYRMLKDSTLRTFHELAEGAEVQFIKGDMASIMRGGGEILWRSADNPDGLRGPNLHWFWSDEGGLTPSDTWKIGIGRLRADGGFGRAWTTSTPKGRRNWLYEQVKTMASFRATTLDNPYTSQEWKESLLGEYSGNFLAQEVYAEFVSFEGLVYNFDASVHIQKRDLKDFVEVGLAIDEGYTNPTAILKVYTDSDGRLHVGEEWYKRGQLQSTVVGQVLEMTKGLKFDVVADSAAAGLIAALRNMGLIVLSTNKNVLQGISKTQELLAVKGDGRPRLTVDPGCVNLINEFESYVWHEGRDEPVKEFDHCLVAGTMVQTITGEVPIENIGVGDMVLTREGYKEVLASGRTGIDAIVVSVKLSNGRTITGTPDHHVWVEGSGFIPLHELRYGSTMSTWTHKRSYSKALNTDGIPMLKIGRSGFIMFRVAKSAVMGWADYIKRYGGMLMVKFRKGVLSIMGMVIRRIMTSIIWNVLVVANTTRFTDCLCRTKEKGSSQSGLFQYDRYQSSGMVRRMGGSGIANTQKKCGVIGKLRNMFANNVGKFTKLELLMVKIGFAQTLASRHSVEHPGSTMKPGYANIAVNNMSVTNTRKEYTAPVYVLSNPVLEDETHDVFDLTVKGAHEFYAEGILVHNSLDALRYFVMRRGSSNRKVEQFRY